MGRTNEEEDDSIFEDDVRDHNIAKPSGSEVWGSSAGGGTMGAGPTGVGTLGAFPGGNRPDLPLSEEEAEEKRRRDADHEAAMQDRFIHDEVTRSDDDQ